MSKTVFLHIGAHKTGTTSLQRFFREHSDKLGEIGYLYPKSAGYSFAQHRLAFALKGMRDPSIGDIPVFDKEIGELLREIEGSPQPHVIISSEELFSLGDDAVALLREALKEFTVFVLAVLRRPDELFASLYNQLVKDPKSPFRMHYAKFLDKPGSLAADMRFEKVFARWAACFGKDALTIRCYEDEPDSVALVCSSVGIELSAFPTTRTRMNRSLSVRAAEIIRLGKHAGLCEGKLRALFEAGERHFRQRPGAESLLTPEDRLCLLRKMDSETEKIFATYLKRENLYASSRFSAGDFPPQSLLTAVDIVRLLGELVGVGER